MIPRLMKYLFPTLLCLLIHAGCSQNQKEVIVNPTQNTENTPIHTFSSDQESLEIVPIPAQDQITASVPVDALSWVFTNYEQTLSWRDQFGNYCAMTLNLPALTPAADFAVEFNLEIQSIGNGLLQEAERAARGKRYPDTVYVDYEAYVYEDLLFIVLNRRMVDGYVLKDIYVFDADAQRRVPHYELPRVLADLEYPNYLIISAALIRNEYQMRYHETVSAMEEEYKNASQLGYQAELPPEVEFYRAKLDAIPYDGQMLSEIRLYPDEEGQLLLWCRIPTLNPDEAIPCSIPFDLSGLSAEEIPNEETAYGSLLDMQFYVDAQGAEGYCEILKGAFVSDPVTFIRYAAPESPESRSTIIGSIIHAASETEKSDLVEMCEAISENELTDLQHQFLETLISALIQ